MEEQIDINKVIANVINYNVERIFTSIKQKVKSLKDAFKVHFKTAFTKYLKNTYEKYHKVKTLFYKAAPQDLYDIFVCPTISGSNGDFDADNVDKFLDVSNFLILKGTGGVGKSMLMKHLFINTLLNKKKNLIPILVELKDFNDSDAPFVDTLYAIMNSLGFDLEKENFLHALDTGGFLFLFDGLDEVNSVNEKRCFKELNELCDRYNNRNKKNENYFFISSRPNNNNHFVPWQRFTVLEAKPFSKTQALQLIDKIHYPSDKKEIFIQQFKDNLYDKHKSFASNPLLLNIMLLTFEDYSEIPDKLHIFYANAFETLFARHDSTKSGVYKREVKSGLSNDQFKKVFAQFCFETYLAGLLKFEENDLTSVLSKCKCNTVNFEVDKFILDLQTTVCLMYKDGFKYFFTHRSFQEYFAALHIQSLDDQEQAAVYEVLADKDSRSSDNVLRMLLDMSLNKFEKNAFIPALEKLEKQISGEQDRFGAIFENLFDEVDFCAGGIFVHIENFRILFITRRTNYVMFKKNNLVQDGICDKMISLFPSARKNFAFSPEEIIANDAAYALLKESWVGEYIDFISDFLNTLKEKHKSKMEQLKEVLEKSRKTKFDFEFGRLYNSN